MAYERDVWSARDRDPIIKDAEPEQSYWSKKLEAAGERLRVALNRLGAKARDLEVRFQNRRGHHGKAAA